MIKNNNTKKYWGRTLSTLEKTFNEKDAEPICKKYKNCSIIEFLNMFPPYK